MNESEYAETMARIDALMGKGPLTDAEGAELHGLACEAEEYEKVHFPIGETADDIACPVCGSCGEVGCGCTKACKPEDPRCKYRDYIARQLAREETAKHMADVTMEYLSTLPPEEQRERLDAFARAVQTMEFMHGQMPAEDPDTPMMEPEDLSACCEDGKHADCVVGCGCECHP